MSPAGGGLLETAFTRQLGIEVPIICGAMYPCTNPELVAAVSEAGGIGIIQPISLTYVYRHEFHAGVRRIRGLTSKPIGMNVLIEKSSKSYHEKMTRWLDIALEEGVRFIITSLGKPDWVVKRVHAAGGLVYHDVTERKWAEKGIDAGVDGLIAVNNRAGGHAGTLSAQELYAALAGYKLPLVCAGGIGSEPDFVAALRMGYAGVQMGTRFIATRVSALGALTDADTLRDQARAVRAKALAETVSNVADKFAKRRHMMRRVDEQAQSGWILIDLGDVVVHLFSPAQRKHYNLEALWKEAKVLLRVQ